MYQKLHRLLNLTFTLSAVTLALGCGGHTHHIGPVTPELPAGPAKAMPALPAPAQLKHRLAAFTESSLMREGSDFDPNQPHTKTSSAGTDLVFAPNFATTQQVADLALALFSFGVKDYNRDANLRLTWATAPAAGTCWVALANRTANHWDWFALPANNQIDIPSIATYTGPAPGFDLYAAIAVTGPGGATLDKLRIGAQPSPGNPTAQLTATPNLGLQPLMVTLDASGSTAAAPATITQYEFDFGEGGGYVNNGTTASTGHIYRTKGSFVAKVRVTDVFGGTSTASAPLTIGVSPNYDEVEDNDTDLTANTLPAVPFNGFRGNVGSGGGYDGDTDDYFICNTQVGKKLSFRLDFTAGTPGLALYDNSGNFLDFSFAASPCTINFTVPAGTPLPLIVDVTSFDVAANYTLSVGLNPPVAALTSTPSQGNVPLDVVLDASGSTDASPGHIVSYSFDPEGDGTFLAPQAGATMPFTYTTAAIYGPVVRVIDDSGLSSTATTSILAGVTFDEVENNDTPATANPLTFPLHNFTGSLGAPGYDGDDYDYFSFSANTGDVVDIQMQLDPQQADFDLYLYDALGNELANSFTTNALEEVKYQITAQDSGPFVVAASWYAGSGTYTLSGSINAPVAKLVAAPNVGTAPLDVVLDASGSTDKAPGTIVSYEFDPEGNGSFQPPQAGATLNYTYTLSDTHSPIVRITDDDGYTALATAYVFTAGTYDEIEPNNAGQDGTLLPAFPFSNLRGSHGAGPGYHGYDGGPVDAWIFNSAANHHFTFTNTYDNTTGELAFELQDKYGDVLLDTYGTGGTATLDYVTGSDPNDGGKPYYLWVWDLNNTHFGDYNLSGVRVN